MIRTKRTGVKLILRGEEVNKFRVVREQFHLSGIGVGIGADIGVGEEDATYL